MGCDGGTIPKRKEIVKNKGRQQRQERNKGASAAEKWRNCALSDWILRKPIVAGHYGHLFSKESIIEFLLEYRKDTLKSYHMLEDKSPMLDTVKNLKDVKELKLMENPDLDEDNDGLSSSQEENIRALWVCPVTGLPTNGKFKFFFSWKCGCVVSERAINEVPNNEKCLVCQKPYQEYDLVQINPETKKEIDLNQAKCMARTMKQIFKEKGLLDKDVPITPTSSQEAASSAKDQAENPQPGTSRSSSSSKNESSNMNGKRSRDDRSTDRSDHQSGSSSHSSKHQRS